MRWYLFCGRVVLLSNGARFVQEAETEKRRQSAASVQLQLTTAVVPTDNLPRFELMSIQPGSVRYEICGVTDK